MSKKPLSDVVPVKVSRRCWYALKRVQAYAPKRMAPKTYASKTRSFRAVLDAIGDGDKELLLMWRKGMREQ